MKIANTFFLIGLAACSRSSAESSTDAASPNPVNSAVVLDAGNSSTAIVDAAIAAREDCAEPKKLTQLKTVNESARFIGEVLESTSHKFDPETGASSELGPSSTVKDPSTPSRYVNIVNGVGLIWKIDSAGAKVEDVNTHKTILQVDNCSAGGSISFALSATGRFLLCDSDRIGESLWDLRAPHPDPKKPLLWGPSQDSDEGLHLSPNDAYAIAVPVMAWAQDKPTRDGITYFDLNTQKSKVLSKAAEPDVGIANARPNSYDVAFCGGGILFVSSGEKEVVVYRGKDGARLAAAPAMKGGLVSFSQSGKYISQTRNQKTTVFRLDP